MSPLVSQVIIWTFLAAFVLCVIGGLLVIFDQWVPKNPKVGKWLVNGVVISIVGAVVGFGTKQFTDPSPAAPAAQAEPAKQTIAGPSATPASPTPTPTPQPSPSPAASPAASDVPEGVRAWAQSTLGDRPTLADIDAHPYPGCVDELGGGSAETVSDESAAQCGRALELYHQQHLLPYYALKRPYALKLTRYEKLLRPDPADPRFVYVAAEIKRLNGAEWDRIAALDAMLIADGSACRTAKCLTPS